MFDHGAEQRPVLSTRALLLGFAGLLVVAVLVGWLAGREGTPTRRGSHRAPAPRPKVPGRIDAALPAAAARGDFEAVAALLQAGVDPDSPSPRGRSALTEAIRAGETEIARALLRAGAEVSSGGARRPADLILAAEHDDAFLIALLVNAGAAVEARDLEGATALHRAGECGRPNAVTALLDASASLEPRDDLGFTPLARAVLAGRLPAVRALLARGAEFSARDLRGRVVLQLAAAGGDPEIVEALLEAGADPHAGDLLGWTSLHEAAALGRTAALRLLLPEYDPASLGARTARGATALHLAARRGEVDCVALLLEAGVDPSVRDADGRRARDLAPATVVDAAWARLGPPAPPLDAQGTFPSLDGDPGFGPELIESALLDAAPRRPLLFTGLRRALAGPEERLGLELAVWEDGAALCSAWAEADQPRLLAGILQRRLVESAVRDLEESGWFEEPLPPAPAASASRGNGDSTGESVIWIFGRDGRYEERTWDSVDRLDDPQRGMSRARFAAWSFSRSKVVDILRTLRPSITRELSFVLTPAREFRGISFDHGVHAPWLQ